MPSNLMSFSGPTSPFEFKVNLPVPLAYSRAEDIQEVLYTTPVAPTCQTGWERLNTQGDDVLSRNSDQARRKLSPVGSRRPCSRPLPSAAPTTPVPAPVTGSSYVQGNCVCGTCSWYRAKAPARQPPPALPRWSITSPPLKRPQLNSPGTPAIRRPLPPLPSLEPIDLTRSGMPDMSHLLPSECAQHKEADEDLKRKFVSLSQFRKKPPAEKKRTEGAFKRTLKGVQDLRPSFGTVPCGYAYWPTDCDDKRCRDCKYNRLRGGLVRSKIARMALHHRILQAEVSDLRGYAEALPSLLAMRAAYTRGWEMAEQRALEEANRRGWEMAEQRALEEANRRAAAESRQLSRQLLGRSPLLV